MARDLDIDGRLQRWAQYVTTGDGNGYAAINPLSSDWSPPSPGTMPTLKTSTSSHEVRETHRALKQLSDEQGNLRLVNTIVTHYCLRLSTADQARQLGCEVRTIELRIERAHRRLRQILGEGGFRHFA